MMNKLYDDINYELKEIDRYLISNNDIINRIIHRIEMKYNKNDIIFILSYYFCLNYESFDEIRNKEIINYETREKRDMQHLLRKNALKKFKKCIISGENKKKCLEAAHIKPYSRCNEYEKNDVDNIILLWMDLHKYYDDYSFTINPYSKTIELGYNLEDEVYEFLRKYEGKKIKNISENSEKYLIYSYKEFKLKNFI